MTYQNFNEIGLVEKIRILTKSITGSYTDGLADLELYRPLFQAQDQTLGISEPHTRWKYSVFTVNADLIGELQDDSRFDKHVTSAFKLVLGDFLISAWSFEESWPKSSRIISSALAGKYLKNYFTMIEDVGSRFCDRIRFAHSSDQFFKIGDDISRATWDVAGLAVLGEDFGSVFSQERPILMSKVNELSKLALQLNVEPFFVQKLRIFRNKKIDSEMNNIKRYFREKISERQSEKNDYEKLDLMGLMLQLRDPVSGEKISLKTLENQAMGLVAAIFETSRSAVQWILYYLCRDQALLTKAYAEVDRIFPDPEEKLSYEKISSLDFLSRVFKEAERISPSIGALNRYCLEDTVVLGKYQVKKGTIFTIPLFGLHNNPKYWNEPPVFNPDRFLLEAELSIHKSAYLPFGIGKRSCAGKGFAFLEVMSLVVNILRNFDITLDPEYKLSYDTSSLAIQPKGLSMMLKPRNQMRAAPIQSDAAAWVEESTPKIDGANSSTSGCPFQHASESASAGSKQSIDIAFGSNGGYGRNIARKLASQASALGFDANIFDLNDSSTKLTFKNKLIVITSTYNGWPPSNATMFIEFLSKNQADINKINYAMIGIGDSTWQSSFLAFPHLVQSKLAQLGATSMLPMLEMNVSKDDCDSALDEWLDKFWLSVGVRRAVSPFALASFRISEIAKYSLDDDSTSKMKYAEVVDNIELINGPISESNWKSTRHITLKLPEGFSYDPGDYIYVIATNSRAQIAQAMHAFKLRAEKLISIHLKDSLSSWIPLNTPISYYDLFMGFIDLNRTMTRHDFALLESNVDGELRAICSRIANSSDDDFQRLVKRKYLSLLNFLEQNGYPPVPIEVALHIFTPLKRRYYSISSALPSNPNELAITVGVLRDKHASGKGVFYGLCSNHLATLNPGNFTLIGILESDFRLPKDPQAPMIWIGAGTGIAPYRSFMQERASLKAKGYQLGPCIMIAGCRQPGHDQLYLEEWNEAEKMHLLKTYWAFSREIVDGVPKKTYVQDIIFNHRTELLSLIDNGAHVYICGDGNTIGKASVEALGKEVFAKLRAEKRAHEDIWGSNK